MIPGEALAEFRQGLSYIPRGVDLVRGQNALLRPALVTFGLYLPVCFIFLSYFPNLAVHFGARLLSLFTPLSAYYGLKALLLLGVLPGVCLVILVLCMLITPLLLCATLAGAFFNEALSRRTERIYQPMHQAMHQAIHQGRSALLAAPPAGGWLRATAIATWEEFKKMLFYLLIQVALLPLNLLPLIGTPLYIVSGGVFTIFFLAFDYLDYSLARRMLPLGQKWRILLSIRWRVAGFGFGLALLSLIPVVNAIVMSMAAAAATMLLVDASVLKTLALEVNGR